MTFDLSLENLLRLAGIGHFAILGASALVPFVLDWKGALKALPPLLRQLFWVYGIFIVLTIIGMGALTFGHARSMANGDPVARSIATFLTVFWGMRLAIQIFIFDARPYLTNAWLRAGHRLLTLAFIFFISVFGTAAFHHRTHSVEPGPFPTASHDVQSPQSITAEHVK